MQQNELNTLEALPTKKELTELLSYLTPLEIEELDKLLFTSGLSFVEFVDKVTRGRFIWYDYALTLAGLLQDVVDGELKRLMVFMPPRHGKSELTSRLLPAYYLHLHPDKWVGINTYAAELSYTFSRAARDNYRQIGHRLKDDAKAVKHWETGAGGGLWAAGVGGPILGKGFDLGIIDDPIKNAEEATSHRIRLRNNDWLDSTFWTRGEPDNAVVLIMQRWSKGDPAGYLLSKEDDEPENWRIINFEAIKSVNKAIYPATCAVIEDTRETGEALSPRYPIDKLKKIAKRIGNFFWNALYQQQPTAREGLVYHQFDADKHVIKDLPAHPNTCTYYHSHDFGAVNEAWGLFAKTPTGKYCLIYDDVLPEGTTARRAKLIQSHFSGRKVLRGWGGAKSEKQQRLDYQAVGLRIQEPPISDVEGGIDAANKMFESGRLFVLQTCHRTIDQLENCVRDDKGDIAEKSIWHNLDVLRYFATGVKGAGGGVVKTGQDRYAN